jgi:hypothetical protein
MAAENPALSADDTKSNLVYSQSFSVHWHATARHAARARVAHDDAWVDHSSGHHFAVGVALDRIGGAAKLSPRLFDAHTSLTDAASAVAIDAPDIAGSRTSDKPRMWIDC